MRELFRELAAARLASEDRARESTFQAWQTVRVYFEAKGKKRLPILADLMAELTRSTPVGRQTAGQVRAALHILSAMYGIPMRQVTRG